jgi:hypothetical protein
MNIPKPVSPQTTELQNQDSRLVIADKACKREIEELTAKERQPSADDGDSLIAMVLADPDNIHTADDSAAKIKTAWAKRAAIDAARQSLKPKIAKAKYDAATTVLESPEVQKAHRGLMQRIGAPLVEIAKAWSELYAMSLECREHGTGFRVGICQTMPLELFSFPNMHSPLGQYLNALVKAGYIGANDVPKEFRAS